MQTEEIEVTMGFGDIINILKEACIYIFTSEKAPYGFWSSGYNALLFAFIVAAFLIIVAMGTVFTFFKSKKYLMWLPSIVCLIMTIIGIIAMFVTHTLESLIFMGYMLSIFCFYTVLCYCILGTDCYLYKKWTKEERKSKKVG